MSSIDIANSIIGDLNYYIGESLTGEDFRFGEVINQLKDVISTLENSGEISIIKGKLEELNKRMTSSSEKDQVESVIALAARNFNLTKKDIIGEGKVGFDPDTVAFIEQEPSLSSFKAKRKLTVEQFNSIPDKSFIGNLDLSYIESLEGVDFSEFTNLRSLNLSGAFNLTAEQFSTIPLQAKNSIETLELSLVNVSGFDFSGFNNLKSLQMYQTKGLTKDQFNSIPKEVRGSIENIFLSDVNIMGFDFSDFESLKQLSLLNSGENTVKQVNSIPLDVKESIESLLLNEVNPKDVFLSDFKKLKSFSIYEGMMFGGDYTSLELESIFKELECLFPVNISQLTAAQFNTISPKSKASIKTLDLRGLDVTGFDFSEFASLTSLNLSNVSGLTATQFNTIASSSKASIKILNLSDLDVTGFDFSEFAGLTSLNLNNVSGLTAAQFNTIPSNSRASIGYLNLTNVDVAGFVFSEFTSLTGLHLDNTSGLVDIQFNEIPSSSKACVNYLTLFNVNVSGFDFSEFTGLSSLIFMNWKGFSAEQFNAIPSSVKASVEFIILDNIDTSGFDFSEFTGFSDANSITFSKGVTAAEINTLPSKVKASTKVLNTYGVNVSGIDFSEFTGLTSLDSIFLAEGLGAEEFNTIPEELRALPRVIDFNNTDISGFDFTGFTGLENLNLTNNRNLTSLPNSILDLPQSCTVDVTGCGLSRAIMERLRETASAEDYQGPRFSYSMEALNPQIENTESVEEILTGLSQLAQKEPPSIAEILRKVGVEEGVAYEEDTDVKGSLRVWLSRLSYMADYKTGGETQKMLAKNIIDYLELANEDPEFRGTFLAVIHGAGDTCGDRMALSVVNLNIAHQIQTHDLSDMKSLAHLLSRGIWAMRILEEIAGEKVKSLPFVDEIEVYLGYPTMLKDQLELPINIGEMLYFACSSIKQGDLSTAEEIVNQQLNNQESLIAFLLTQDKWNEALKKNFPEELQTLLQQRDTAVENSNSNEEDIAAADTYKQGFNELVKSILN
jgi:hypothetical protein